MPIESQLRNGALRLLVRQLLENGRLPVILPKQIAAGYGSGRVCAACDEPITSTQVEYEVDECLNGGRLRFHMGCHVVWQLECARGLDTASKLKPAARLRMPARSSPQSENFSARSIARRSVTNAARLIAVSSMPRV